MQKLTLITITMTIYVQGLSNDMMYKQNEMMFVICLILPHSTNFYNFPVYTTPPFYLYSFDWNGSSCGARKWLGWKRFAAGGTHQPHSQVHLAFMCGDGGRWGWWALLTALNLAPVYLFDAPQLNMKGCILVGMASSEAGGAAGEADFIAWSAGSETSGPVDSWGDGGGWGVADFLVRRWGWDMEECNIAPLRSP